MSRSAFFLVSFFSLLLSTLHAQTDMQALLGDWDIVSFEDKALQHNTANIYYRIVYEMSEEETEGEAGGEFVIDQVRTKDGQEDCYCSGLVLLWPETKELEIDFVVSCSDQDPTSELAQTSTCDFWPGSEQRYKLLLNQDRLTLENPERKIVLKRR